MSKPTGRSLQQEAWSELKKNKVAMVSSFLILFICLVAVLAPWISPYAFDEQYLDKVLASPVVSIGLVPTR